MTGDGHAVCKLVVQLLGNGFNALAEDSMSYSCSTCVQCTTVYALRGDEAKALAAAPAAAAGVSAKGTSSACVLLLRSV